MSRRPVVLLPPDLETQETRRGPQPRLVSQREYADAILEAGGLPLIPPIVDDAGALDQLVALADALVLPGGDFDVDPAHYGEQPHEALGKLLPERTALEWGLLVRAENKGIPVLGVCGGMQLMNVVRGGTLWQDLDAQKPDNAGHSQKGRKDEPCHDVALSPGTRLRALVSAAGGPDRLPVNSTHHQAVKALAPGLVESARAADGVVEAFEDPKLRFFVAVQWHPEAMREPAQRAIYAALVAAAASGR